MEVVMPGYMMHLCEGKCILDILKSSDISTDFSDDFCNDFLTGCVLPDATDDKSLTHFRPSWQNDLITKYPDKNYLLRKHPLSQLSALDFGILAHLILDADYVTELWPQFFRFEDKCGAETARISDIAQVRMTGLGPLPGGTLVSLDEFFSDAYFYGDYDATNPLFARDFHPVLPHLRKESLCGCSFDITGACSISKLSEDLSGFTGTKKPGCAQTHIFTYEHLKGFVLSSAKDFAELLTGAL